MRTTLEIDKQIRAEAEYMAQLYAQIRLYENGLEHLKREREEAEEFERKSFIDAWLRETFGIQNQEEARDGLFIVFDRNANFVKTVTCGYNKDFPYVSPPIETNTLEHWLKMNKYYAHCASSFCDRSRSWYEMSFQEQLKNLSWEFDEDGKIIKTQW